MNDININKQSLPNRCEICHQSDSFDAVANHCSRCGDNNAGLNNSAPMPNVKINIYFELQPADLSRAQWAIITRRWYNWIWLAVITVLPLYSFSLTMINWSNVSLGALLTTLLPILFFILIIFLSLFISRRRALQTSKDLQQQIRYTFAFDGFDISAGKTFSHMSWESLWKVIETSESFLLYQNNAVYNLVPKRCFANQTEIDQLREILRANLAKKAELLANRLSFYQQPKFGFGIYLLLVSIGLTLSSYHSYSLYRGIQLENLAKEVSGFMSKNNFLAAEPKYREMITLQPNNADHYENLGICLFRTGRLNDAAIEFRHALQLKPQSTGILQWLASVAVQLKDYPAAVNYYQQALTIEPNSIALHYQLGYTYTLMEQRPQAVEQFKRVMEISPTNIYSRIVRDYIDGKREKVDLAIDLDDLDDE